MNAGQNPPLIRRRSGRYERLTATGVALGMFEGSTFTAARTTVQPGESLVLYSDGITEAENPIGQPFEETGLEQVLDAARGRVTRSAGRHACSPRSNGMPIGHVSPTI